MSNREYFEQQMKLKTYGTFEIQDGQISFLGMLRVFEQGTNVYRVMIANRPPMYGEWQTRFEQNGNDLNVQIITFGYSDVYNVGNPHPRARIKLRASEIAEVERLIRGIFKTDHLRKNVNPFTSEKANFLGAIGFESEWVLRE